MSPAYSQQHFLVFFLGNTLGIKFGRHYLELGIWSTKSTLMALLYVHFVNKMKLLLVINPNRKSFSTPVRAALMELGISTLSTADDALIFFT